MLLYHKSVFSNLNLLLQKIKEIPMPHAAFEMYHTKDPYGHVAWCKVCGALEVVIEDSEKNYGPVDCVPKEIKLCKHKNTLRRMCHDKGMTISWCKDCFSLLVEYDESKYGSKWMAPGVTPENFSQFSANELKMFKDLDVMRFVHGDNITLEYDDVVSNVFLNNKTGPAVEALRRAYKALRYCKPNRMTPEFEELIKYV
jgi:hypothetical protein